jgi:hypothetical protein
VKTTVISEKVDREKTQTQTKTQRQRKRKPERKKKPLSREEVLKDVKKHIEKRELRIPYNPGTPERQERMREAIMDQPKEKPERRKTGFTEDVMRGYVASGKVSQARYDKWEEARKKPQLDQKMYLTKSGVYRTELEKELVRVSKTVNVYRKKVEKRVTKRKGEDENSDSEEVKQMTNKLEKREAGYKDMSQKRKDRSDLNEMEKAWVFMKHPSVIERRKEKNEKK